MNGAFCFEWLVYMFRKMLCNCMGDLWIYHSDSHSVLPVIPRKFLEVAAAMTDKFLTTQS